MSLNYGFVLQIKVYLFNNYDRIKKRNKKCNKQYKPSGTLHTFYKSDT